MGLRFERAAKPDRGTCHMLPMMTPETPPPDDEATFAAPPVPARNTPLIVLAACASIALLRYTQEVVIPFVLAGLTFYALDPMVDRLQRWRVPRALGAALMLLVVVAVLGGLFYSLADDVVQVVEDLPPAAERLRTLLREMREGTTGGAMEKLEEAATALDETTEAAAGASPAPKGVVRVQVEDEAPTFGDYVRLGPVSAMYAVGDAVMILFLAYFLLITDDLFKRKLVEVAGPTLARKKVTVQVLNQIASQIESFLLVQIFTSVVVGIATWLALWWVGVNNAAVWGLFAGLFNSVPYFGPLIVTGGLTAIAFVQFGTVTMALTVAGIALLITTIEGWVLTPLLMSRVSQINPVAIFAALMFWSWMWGLWGLLLAVPITMAIKATCDRVEGLEPVGKLLGE